MISRPLGQHVTTWLSCLIVVSIAAATAAAQSIAPATGLRPGETYFPIQNDCGVIVDTATETLTTAQRASIGQLVWTGQCDLGLANGAGLLATPDTAATFAQSGIHQEREYVAGRPISKTTSTLSNIGTQTSYSLSGRNVNMLNMDSTLAPKWESSRFTYVIVSPNGHYDMTAISLETQQCTVLRDIFKTDVVGCTDKDNFKTYFVFSTNSSPDHAAGQRRVICPDPRTTAGCDAVWRQEIAKLVDVPAFIAEVDAHDVQLRRDASKLAAAWAAASPARLAEQKRKAATQAAMQASQARMAAAQAKAAVASAAFAGKAAASSGAPAGKSSGKSCTALIYEYNDVINNAQIPAAVSHELWAQLQFVRLANALPACRGDTTIVPSIQQAIENDRRDCPSVSGPGVDCVNGDFGGGAPYSASVKAQVEEGFQKIVNANRAPAPAPSSQQATTTNACTREISKWNATLSASNARGKTFNLAEHRAGAKAVFQHSMWVFGEHLKVLDTYCKGQPQYSGYSGLKASYDAAKHSCVQLSSDNGETCVAKQLY